MDMNSAVSRLPSPRSREKNRLRIVNNKKQYVPLTVAMIGLKRILFFDMG